MPITDILTKNADFYPNDVSLVEINPKLEDNRNMTWREFALTQSTAAETYRKEITWGEFQKKSNRFANLLLSRGIKKGDKVAILLMNCLEWLPIYFGILRAGAVAVPLNFRYTADEIAYCLNKSDSEYIVFGPEFVGRVEEICHKVKRIKMWIYAGEDCPAYAESYDKLVTYCSSKAPKVELTDDDLVGYYRLPEGDTSFAPCAHARRQDRAGAPRADQGRRFSLHTAALSHGRQDALVRQLPCRRQGRAP